MALDMGAARGVGSGDVLVPTGAEAASSSAPGPSRYDAFISYSHAADGKLAPALQSGLHRLARPWYRRRALHVFRDKTSLAVTPALWTTICEALAASGHFLLLASPEAAQSHWVQQEVQWWLAHRSPQTLFIVLTNGTLAWDSKPRQPNDGSPPRHVPTKVSVAPVQDQIPRCTEHGPSRP